jgi:peptidoglycan/LPS O-acetylase OafA/YrhL
MARLIEEFRYRPEIDGLRALAVLAVVLFHAGLGVPGGFVGVDVFFVISGFLITSLILKDLQAGNFSLARLWERRARRIIPAAVVMVAAVLAAGWFLLSPSDYASLGKSAAWQALFGANIHFWRSTNYFAGAAEEQPLLHTWSLAVEEQFYVFVPFVLLFLFRYPLFRRRGPLLVLLIPALTISLALSVFLLPRAPAATFYLLPTRAWELLAGSVVALLPTVTLSRLWREVLCGLALAAILAPCFLYTKETPFPGFAALPSCLGTCLLIWVSSDNRPGARAPLSAVGSLLSSRPLVFIGLISYSLYLWHWPLFAFSRYCSLAPIPLGIRSLLVVVSFLLALLSWKFVETPFRQRQLGKTRQAMFGYAGAGLVSSVFCGSILQLREGLPARLPASVQLIAKTALEAKHMRDRYPETTLNDALAGKFIHLGVASENPVEPPCLFVWGDSQAGAILPAFETLAEECNREIVIAWHAGTKPALGYIHYNRYSFGDKTIEYSNSIFEYIKRARVPNVLLVAAWPGDSAWDASHENRPLAPALLGTVSRLNDIGCKVFVLRGIPRHQVEIPKAVFLREVFGTDIRSYIANGNSFSRQWDGLRPFEKDLAEAGANFIDISELIIIKETGECEISDSEGIFFSDHVHLSPHGARRMRDVFRSILLQ